MWNWNETKHKLWCIITKIRVDRWVLTYDLFQIVMRDYFNKLMSAFWRCIVTVYYLTNIQWWGKAILSSLSFKAKDFLVKVIPRRFTLLFEKKKTSQICILFSHYSLYWDLSCKLLLSLSSFLQISAAGSSAGGSGTPEIWTVLFQRLSWPEPLPVALETS